MSCSFYWMVCKMRSKWFLSQCLAECCWKKHVVFCSFQSTIFSPHVLVGWLIDWLGMSVVLSKLPSSVHISDNWSTSGELGSIIRPSQDNSWFSLPWEYGDSSDIVHSLFSLGDCHLLNCSQCQLLACDNSFRSVEFSCGYALHLVLWKLHF